MLFDAPPFPTRATTAPTRTDVYLYQETGTARVMKQTDVMRDSRLKVNRSTCPVCLCLTDVSAFSSVCIPARGGDFLL
jgi:hypothetical protein